jgi:hypothetical protein
MVECLPTIARFRYDPLFIEEKLITMLPFITDPLSMRLV